MTITLNGSTGINTPGVVNTAAETIATTLAVTGVTTIAAGSAAAPSLVGTTGGATTGVWFPAASTVAFATAATERARILSTGEFISGGTVVDDSGAVCLVPRTPASGACGILAFNKGNSGTETCLRFKYQGTIVGSIVYNSTATGYNTSSDYRLKEDIVPMTGALAKVALLKPCTYKWKVDGSDGQGFIAHELDEVVSGCVTGEKDAVDAEGKPQYQGIDTSFLVATLTAAIQEQQALITSLTTRLTALENK